MGIIGFALVDKTKARMLDLMFSCRSQRKLVDVSAVRRIMELYAKQGHKRFEIVFRRTRKNELNASLFKDLGLQVSRQEDGAEILSCNIANLPPDPKIVTVSLSQ